MKTRGLLILLIIYLLYYKVDGANDKISEYPSSIPTFEQTLNEILYVNINGTNLNNNCTEINNPCASITYAISIAQPGATIQIASGIYYESNIAIQQNLTIIGELSELNEITVQMVPPNRLSSNAFSITLDSYEYINIEGISFENYTKSALMIIHTFSILKPSSPYGLINNCKFTGNSGPNIISISNFHFIITNCYFQSNSLNTETGNPLMGVISYLSLSNNDYITIVNSSFIENSLQGSDSTGSAISITTTGSVYLDNCLFQANSLRGFVQSSPISSGGTLGITSIGSNVNVSLLNSQFLDNYVIGPYHYPSSAFIIQASNAAVKLINCSCIGNIVNVTSVYSSYSSQGSTASIIGALSDDYIPVIIDNVNFDSNFALTEQSSIKGTFALTTGIFLISNSNFTRNTIQTIGNGNSIGAGLMIVNDAQITNCIFSDNLITTKTYTYLSDSFGGAMYLSVLNSINISSSIFSSNRIEVEMDTEGFVYDIVGGAIAAGGVNENSTFSIFDTMFINNSISIDVFGGYSSTISGGAMYLDLVITVIDNCTFNENSINVTSTIMGDYSGGAISSITSLTISNSEFNSNYLWVKGLTSSIYPINGGAIYTAFDQLTITSSNLTGNSIYCDNFIGGALLTGGAISASIHSLYADKIILSDNSLGCSNDCRLLGAGMSALPLNNITINNGIFQNNTADLIQSSGGGLYMNDQYWDTIPIIEMNNNSFIGNTAGFGGGIYMSYSMLSSLSTSNISWIGNVANVGGANYFNTSSNPTSISSDNFNSFLFSNNHNFVNNKNNIAKKKMEKFLSLYNNDKEKIRVENNNNIKANHNSTQSKRNDYNNIINQNCIDGVYDGNIAIEYGPDCSSNPISFNLIDPIINLTQPIVVWPGKKISLNFAVIDQYYNYVNSSLLELLINYSNDESFQSGVSGNSISMNSNSTFIVNNAYFRGHITNQKHTIVFYILPTYPETYSATLSLEFIVIQCAPSFTFDETLQICTECPAYTYNFNGSSICEPCPTSIGGISNNDTTPECVSPTREFSSSTELKLTINDGYYPNSILNPNTLTLCPNQRACHSIVCDIYFDEVEIDWEIDCGCLGQSQNDTCFCFEGYENRLCSECAPGYYSISDYHCALCTYNADISVLFFFINFIIIICLLAIGIFKNNVIVLCVELIVVIILFLLGIGSLWFLIVMLLILFSMFLVNADIRENGEVILKSIVFYIQSCGLILVGLFKWSSLSYMNYISIPALGGNGMGCYVDNYALIWKFWLAMLIPILLLFVYLFFVLIYLIRRKILLIRNGKHVESSPLMKEDYSNNRYDNQILNNNENYSSDKQSEERFESDLEKFTDTEDDQIDYNNINEEETTTFSVENQLEISLRKNKKIFFNATNIFLFVIYLVYYQLSAYVRFFHYFIIYLFVFICFYLFYLLFN